MKAIGYLKSYPIEHPESLLAVEIPQPIAGPKDLVVRVMAVSMNPVDTKMRRWRQSEDGKPVVLGWDAAGVVESVGKEVQGFHPGDKVYYAGELNRQGSNAEFQAVDYRIVGRMPKNASFEAAASLPLTALTAWESLFDRLQVSLNQPGKSILVIGGAGGVGSVALQLLKSRTQLQVIATASTEASIQWCKDLGAKWVINHRQNMVEQVHALGIQNVDSILCLTHTDQHLAAMVELVKPQGRVCFLDEPEKVDINVFKPKCVSIHWELMFTRSLFQTEDMAEQGKILNEVAKLVESGSMKTTEKTVLHGLEPSIFKKAHQLLESTQTLGKVVIGF